MKRMSVSRSSLCFPPGTIDWLSMWKLLEVLLGMGTLNRVCSAENPDGASWSRATSSPVPTHHWVSPSEKQPSGNSLP